MPHAPECADDEEHRTKFNEIGGAVRQRSRPLPKGVTVRDRGHREGEPRLVGIVFSEDRESSGFRFQVDRDCLPMVTRIDGGSYTVRCAVMFLYSQMHSSGIG